MSPSPHAVHRMTATPDDSRTRRRCSGLCYGRRRAMVATGITQRDIADALGVSQPAVSQQLRNARDLATVDPRPQGP